VELRKQGAFNAICRFVSNPETIAEGLNDVIGRHTDVSRSSLNHL